MSYFTSIKPGNLSPGFSPPQKPGVASSHGQQLSAADKQRLAGILWRDFGAMKPGERTSEIKDLLSVSERTINTWTKNAREKEKEEQQNKAWDMWLDCFDAPDIAVTMGFITEDADADERNSKSNTVRTWINEKRKAAEFVEAPGSTDKKPWGNIQHFDIWPFAKADGDSTYFAQMPPHAIVILSCFF